VLRSSIRPFAAKDLDFFLCEMRRFRDYGREGGGGADEHGQDIGIQGGDLQDSVGQPGARFTNV
jgi:hypothetical protein